MGYEMLASETEGPIYTFTIRKTLTRCSTGSRSTSAPASAATPAPSPARPSTRSRVGQFRTWVKYVDKGEYPSTTRDFGVMRCNHCTDAPCVTICPTKSLFKRDDGIVDFDQRQVHRLQELHAGLPLRRALHRRGHAHRRQVQLLCAPHRPGPGAGLRGGLSHRVDLGRRPGRRRQRHPQVPEHRAGPDQDARTEDRAERVLRGCQRGGPRPAGSAGRRHLHLGGSRRPARRERGATSPVDPVDPGHDDPEHRPPAALGLEGLVLPVDEVASPRARC